MRLEEVRMKNFRAYRDEISIPISSLTTFIGKNDIGKSSILEVLEIFFNNGCLVTCEREDLSVDSQGNDVEITCIFSDFPSEIIIDSSAKTRLDDEYLLNGQGKLEIRKSYTCTAAKPKERIFIQCVHPGKSDVYDLLSLKRKDLILRAKNLGVDENAYNANINTQIRKAIWAHTEDLQLRNTALLVDEEDTKKIYEELRKYLPTYAWLHATISDRKLRRPPGRKLLAYRIDREPLPPCKVRVKGQPLRGGLTRQAGWHGGHSQSIPAAISCKHQHTTGGRPCLIYAGSMTRISRKML